MSAPAAERSLLARARPLLLARLAAAAISFAIPLALARRFRQDEYGTYKLLLLVANTLGYVLPMGMAQSLYYFVPRLSARRALLCQTLLFLLGAGLLALAGVNALSPWLARALNNPALEGDAPRLGLYMLGLLGSMPLEIVLTARGQISLAALTYLASDLLKAAAMVLPALLGWGLDGVLDGLCAFAIARLIACWLALGRGEAGPAFDRAVLARQLRYALPFGAAMLLSVPQGYFHQFLVSARLDAASFAVYSVGLLQLPVIDLLYTPTTEMLMIRIAELERAGAPQAAAAVFREAMAHLALAFVPLTALLLAVAPELVFALFTARYAAAVPIFRVASLGVLLACLPVDGALRARDQTRHLFASYLLKAALTVPLALLLVSRFGMMGGVASWLLAEVAGKLALLWRVPRALGVRPGALLPFAQLARAAAASAAALGGVFAARALLGPGAPPPLTLVVASGAFGVAYVAALVAVGADLPFKALLGRG